MVGPVGTFQTCFNMLKIFLGIGILATPETFKKIGIVGGVLGLIIIGLLNGYTMMLQIYAKIKLNKQVVSYSDLGEKVLGVSGRRIVDFCMVTSQVGFGIAYLLFVGNQIDQVVCFESNLTKCGRKNLYISLASLFLMPVCWFRSMNYLAYVSIASNICLFLSCKLYHSKIYLLFLQCL